MAAGGGMDPVLLGGLLMLAAILGDSTNYVIGRTVGERLFSNPNSKIFRRDYLQQTHDFYDKHGGKTVTLARFMPIIRTFAPFVAGVGKMPYPRFFAFSILGTILWVGGLVTSVTSSATYRSSRKTCRCWWWVSSGVAATDDHWRDPQPSR